MFIPRSIRWRLQLWLAFLLVSVLSGFGLAVYQLQNVHLLTQFDEELQARVAALNTAVRSGPPFDPGRGRSRPDKKPGYPGEDPPARPPPPPDGAPGPRSDKPAPAPGEPFDLPPHAALPPLRPGPRQRKLS